MKLIVIVLNKMEVLEDLLEEFAENDVHGATIMHSTGMARAIHPDAEHNFFGTLRLTLDPERERSHTVLTVIRDDQVQTVLRIVDKVVGGIDTPDSAVAFTVPVDGFWGAPLSEGE